QYRGPRHQHRTPNGTVPIARTSAVRSPAGSGRLWRTALPAAPAAHPHAAGSPRTGTPPTPGRLRPVPAPPPPPPPPTPAATVDAATTTLDVSLAAAHHPTCLPPGTLSSRA